MTEPTRHPEEPAEGAEHPGSGESGRTPHPQDPAEGASEPVDEPTD
jgi:hypothetical protein